MADLTSFNPEQRVVDKKLLVKTTVKDSSIPTSVNSDFKQILSKQSMKVENIKSQEITVNGTDIATKELAIELENQFLGIIWNMIADRDEKDMMGGLAEKLFSRDYLPALIESGKTGHDLDGQMGQIAQNIYNQLRQNQDK